MKTIRELREAQGWSQFELAVKVGVTPNTVGRWERGEVEPKFTHARTLSALFGVPMERIALVEREEGKAAARWSHATASAPRGVGPGGGDRCTAESTRVPYVTNGKWTYP